MSEELDAIAQAHAIVDDENCTGFVILAFQKYAPPILFCMGKDECPVSATVDPDEMIAGETLHVTISKSK